MSLPGIEKPRIGVVIPVLNGARYVPKLLEALRSQSEVVHRILVIDSASIDDSASLAKAGGADVLAIARADFNHGSTRNRGAARLIEQGCDIIVFMTQDALPANRDYIGRLTSALREGVAAAAYARQIPYPEATPLEVFTRSFNYPGDSRMKSEADSQSMGLKAYFFSNVASAVRADAFQRVGGFPGDVIMNEDMVICARLLRSGCRVAYCADAVVFHSHNYTLRQQFRRYFDIGAFLSGNAEVGGRVGGEGLRFVRGQLGWCWRTGAKSWIPRCIVESGLKFTGMHLGKRHHLLPRWLKRRCSMHAYHWR